MSEFPDQELADRYGIDPGEGPDTSLTHWLVWKGVDPASAAAAAEELAFHRSYFAAKDESDRQDFHEDMSSDAAEWVDE